MAPVSLTFVGGLLMGLASSLHCAGMCGGIASSLMFAFSPGDDPLARVRAHFAAQAGRVAVYMASGTFLGGVGAAFYGAFDHPAAYLALRWAAAVALGWIGLSVAGFAPSLAGIDTFTAPVTNRLAAATSLAGRHGGAFLSGLIWGFLPCGIVYGALFYAMLSGSALGGIQVMAGFGLGTLPSVTAVALGLGGLRRIAHAPRTRIAVGLGIMTVAAASAAIPAATIAALCGM